MSKGLKQAITGLLIVPLMAIGVTTLVQAGNIEIAGAASTSEITNGMESSIDRGKNNVPTSANEVFKTITNIMFFIIGAVSVIMLIYGGIRYTTSGGNANNVTAAKNTIMYSIIGLVVAILAYAIVRFVVNQMME